MTSAGCYNPGEVGDHPLIWKVVITIEGSCPICNFGKPWSKYCELKHFGNVMKCCKDLNYSYNFHINKTVDVHF